MNKQVKNMTERFEKSIRTLELPRVLELLAHHAVSQEAKERALALRPATELEDVQRLQAETAAAVAMGREAHDEGVEGKPVTLAQAREQLRMLSAMTLEQRMLVPGLPPGRAMHFPHGLCILIAGLEAAGFDGFTVSGRTNLDGYLLSLDD